MNVYLKRFVLFFCFISLFSFNFRLKYAYANPAIIIGGLGISGEAIVAIGAISLYAGSATLNLADGTDSKLLHKMGEDLVATGHAAEYLGVQVSNTGQKFLTWTADGLNWFNEQINAYRQTGSFTVSASVNTGDIVYTGSCTAGKDYKEIQRITYNFTSSVSSSFDVVLDGIHHYSSSRSYPRVDVVIKEIPNATAVNVYWYSSVTSADSAWVNYHQLIGSSIGSFDIVYTGSLGESVCSYPVSTGVNKYDNTVNQDVIGSNAPTGSLGLPLTPNADGTVSFPSLPSVSTWGDIAKDYTYDKPVDIPIDTPIDTTGTIDTDVGVFNIPILGDILKVLRDILTFLKGLVGSLITGLITALKELLTTLFIPDATFISDKFISLEADLISKFPTDLTLLTDVGNTSENNMDFVYHFTVFGVYLTLDINFIKQVAPYSRMVANGLVAIFLVWYHFRKIIWLIRGSAPIGGDGHSGLEHGGISVDGGFDSLSGGNSKRLN